MCFSCQQFYFPSTIFLVYNWKINSSHALSIVDVFVIQDLIGFYFYLTK